jgi:hypothetical protein
MKRSSHDHAIHCVVHDLDEIHMLNTIISSTSSTAKKSPLVADQQGTMRKQHASAACLTMTPRKCSAPAEANRTADPGTVLGRKRKVHATTNTKTIPIHKRPQQKKPNTTKVLPQPPNVYCARHTNPPHMDPNKLLTSSERKAAWAEYYRIEMLERNQTVMPKAKETMRSIKGQTRQASHKLVATTTAKILRDHNPNMATVSKSAKPKAENHLRKLSVSASKTRHVQETAVNEKAAPVALSPEHNGIGKTVQEQSNAFALPQAEQALAVSISDTSSFSTEESSTEEEQRQQQSKNQYQATKLELQRDQESRRLREVEALEVFGISTMKISRSTSIF